MGAPSRSPQGTPRGLLGPKQMPSPETLPTSPVRAASLRTLPVLAGPPVPGRGAGVSAGRGSPLGLASPGLGTEPGRARSLAVWEAIRWRQQRLESWAGAPWPRGGGWSEDIFSVESSCWLSAPQAAPVSTSSWRGLATAVPVLRLVLVACLPAALARGQTGGFWTGPAPSKRLSSAPVVCFLSAFHFGLRWDRGQTRVSPWLSEGEVGVGVGRGPPFRGRQKQKG